MVHLILEYDLEPKLLSEPSSNTLDVQWILDKFL